MLQENEGPKPAEDQAVEGSTKMTPAERHGRRDSQPEEPDTQGAIEHFGQEKFDAYDGPDGVDTGADHTAGLGKDLKDRREEAEQAQQKNTRKNKIVATVTGGIAVASAVVAGVLPGGSGEVPANPVRDGDKPALTVPNNPSLAPSAPQEVKYNGVHTADAPMESTLPTAPEDIAFGQELAERNEQAEQRAIDAVRENTGGAAPDTQAETGGARPQD